MKTMNTLLLFIFTIFSLFSFSGILLGADPYTSGAMIKILFFVTLFFSAIGVFAMSGIWGSRLLATLRPAHGKPLAFNVAFRRGLLLALMSVAIVALEAGSILNVGNAFAVFLLVVTLEMIAVYKK